MAVAARRPLTATAPSSPKPEEGIPATGAPGSVTPPPPGSGAPAEQAPTTTEAPDSPGGATPVEEADADEEPEPRMRTGRPQQIDLEDAESRFLSGMLVGIALARRSAFAAEAIQAILIDGVAAGYGVPADLITLGVDADADTLLADYRALLTKAER
jgi:hypothetical protein